MKTQEEIEKQARKYAFINPNQKPIDEEERYYIGAPAIGKYDGFVEGFKQCQQENIEVKYTVDDIRSAFFNGFVTKSTLQKDENVEEAFQFFVKALGK